MKYMLIAILFLAGCGDQYRLKAEDVEMADCICQKKTKDKAAMVHRNDSLGIEFRCESGFAGMHYDSTYTAGCSKLPEK